MPTDPSLPLNLTERLVFGEEATRHPITGIPIELGSGALPADQQAILHCQVIEETEGRAAADAMRKKLADAKAARVPRMQPLKLKQKA